MIRVVCEHVAAPDRAPDVGGAVEGRDRTGRHRLVLEAREVHRGVELEEIRERGEAGARVQIVGGELVVSPRPAPRHTLASSTLGSDLLGAFGRGGGSGWIAHAGEFPSPQKSEFPLARDAERYYRNGPPLLQRYLPFWLANLVERMWVALFSIAVILIPLGRVVPPLYQFRIRSRIFRWYRELRRIEDALGRKDADPVALLEDLEKLELKAERITVPLAYTDELYHLRSHIALVRARLKLARSG